jgi:hypothetical protein
MSLFLCHRGLNFLICQAGMEADVDKSDDHPIDFSKLAKEAAAESYNPRATRCWPWTHAWTMWQKIDHGNKQERRCTGCGKVHIKVLSKAHEHTWKTIEMATMWSTPRGQLPIGWTYIQECIYCHTPRRVDLTQTQKLKD